MVVLNNVEVIQNVQHMNRSQRYTTLLLEDAMEIPGFSRSNLIAEGNQQHTYTTPECFVESINGLFLSNISFIRTFIELAISYKQSAHGPCLSDEDETLDVGYCFHLYFWPRQAEQWIYRHRPG